MELRWKYGFLICNLVVLFLGLPYKTQLGEAREELKRTPLLILED
jgi:hypothetical protein